MLSLLIKHDSSKKHCNTTMAYELVIVSEHCNSTMRWVKPLKTMPNISLTPTNSNTRIMATEKICTWWAARPPWAPWPVRYSSRSQIQFKLCLSALSGSKATQSWYDEIKDYNFGKPGFSMATGHFTQVVWKGSNRLGVGIAFANGNRKAVVVTNYSPPGNYQGQFGQHVFAKTC